MTSNMIRKRLKAKMLENLRNNLIAMTNVTLDELAATANNIIFNRKMQICNELLYAIKRRNDNLSLNLKHVSDVSSQIEKMENKLNNLLRLIQDINRPKSFEGSQSNHALKQYRNSQPKRFEDKQRCSIQANQPNHNLTIAFAGAIKVLDFEQENVYLGAISFVKRNLR